MILQALHEYYRRKAADPEGGIAPEGLEPKPIPFIITIDSEGNFLSLEDTREGEGKAKLAKTFLVPRGENRAGPGAWKLAYLLWDHFGYVLGQSRTGDVKDKDLAKKQHESFIARLRSLPEKIRQSSRIAPILRFYEKSQEHVVASSNGFDECLKISGCNLTFRISGDPVLPIEDPAILTIVQQGKGRSGEGDEEEDSDAREKEGICSITGEWGLIARKHSRTPINKDTKSLVAIQRNSGYDSYGKEQGYNCSVGQRTEFAYSTALNSLLRNESNRIQMGNDRTVFWSQKADSILEKNMKPFFSAFGSKADDPDRGVADAKASLLSVLSGIPPQELQTKFFILGLSPNSARIAVRYWHQGSIADFCSNMRQNFDDLDIVAPDFDVCRMSLQYLLGSVIRDRASPEDLPPHLAGDMVRTVIEGLPYPETLFNQCMRRIRAAHFDDSRRNRYDYEGRIRAALLKAHINRKRRKRNSSNEKEITVALDPENSNQGYRLGRLFAALEKIQEDANPGINTTIRDRFYGAASSTPVSVFPQLLKLKNHHLSKLENVGFRISHERRLAKIIGGLGTSMPAHLSMDDQARFALGYYHQRQALFASNKDNNA